MAFYFNSGLGESSKGQKEHFQDAELRWAKDMSCVARHFRGTNLPVSVSLSEVIRL